MSALDCVEWWLISTRRVERRTGRQVDGQAHTALEKEATPAAPVCVSAEVTRNISVQGTSRRKSGVSKRLWKTGTQARNDTTTVSIYDLSSRSISELRGSRVKDRVVRLTRWHGEVKWSFVKRWF